METKSSAAGAKKIFVIDDDQVVLKAMHLMLTAKGYHVETAETGADAISLLRKNKPDLVLLDLDFPPDIGNIGGGLRDGFLIIDWARRMCDAEKIPVIIVSSLDPEKYKERAQAAKIPAFFRKPVEREVLLRAIHTALGDAPAGQPA